MIVFASCGLLVFCAFTCLINTVCVRCCCKKQLNVIDNRVHTEEVPLKGPKKVLLTEERNVSPITKATPRRDHSKEKMTQS